MYFTHIHLSGIWSQHACFYRPISTLGDPAIFTFPDLFPGNYFGLSKSTVFFFFFLFLFLLQCEIKPMTWSSSCQWWSQLPCKIWSSNIWKVQSHFHSIASWTHHGQNWRRNQHLHWSQIHQNITHALEHVKDICV